MRLKLPGTAKLLAWIEERTSDAVGGVLWGDHGHEEPKNNEGRGTLPLSLAVVQGTPKFLEVSE